MDYFSTLIQYLSDIETLLITLIAVFILITLVLFSIIMIYRGVKIFDTNYIISLKEQYDEVFMNASFSEPGSLPEHIEKAKQLNTKYLGNKRHARIITNELIHLANTFSGESKNNLNEIYVKAGFLEYSENKIKSGHWESVAQGIREIAAMKTNTVTEYVKHLRKSTNRLIAENAQLTLVKIKGFGGLDFLNEIQEPVSDWQQINLIEALKEYATASVPDFTKWLESKEKSVVLFAIRLIRYFKKIDNGERLIPLLKHKDDKIKAAAIQTLTEFGNRQILDQLIDSYTRESHTIQIEIIKAYASLADSNTIGVLPLWIKRTNDMEIQKTCIEAILALNVLDELKLLCASDAGLQTRVKPFMNI